jgi:hypothetical protein
VRVSFGQHDARQRFLDVASGDGDAVSAQDDGRAIAELRGQQIAALRRVDVAGIVEYRRRAAEKAAVDRYRDDRLIGDRTIAPTSGRRLKIPRWIWNSLGGSSPMPTCSPVRRSTRTISDAKTDERLALRELIHMMWGCSASRAAT